MPAAPAHRRAAGAPPSAPAWLVPLLAERAPGRRVAVFGGDTEPAAVELAAAGFEVTGLDRHPAAELDAAVCLRSLGLETAAEHRRFFRRLGRCLPPGGTLVVAAEACGRGDAPALVREAGFHVDPSPAAPAAGGAIVARRGSVPPGGVADESYRRQGPPPALDLRWCPDEVEWVRPSPQELWAPLFAAGPRELADLARRYSVDDPYGAERACGIVSQHFGSALDPEQITFGAGSSALLHDFLGLAEGGPILSPRLTHPDFAAWATAAGVEVQLLEETARPDAWIQAIRRQRPGVVHLDRPSVLGERVPLADLEAIARAAAEAGCPVLVDEAYGSYFAGRGSAVSLVGRLPNLVILRSLSKAYTCGGLRAGFAVASRELAADVRGLAVSLQTSELAYQMALRLLAAGDIFALLRARIRAMKAPTAALLEGLGLEVVHGHPDLPWVLLRDAGGAAWEALRARGVEGKRLALSPVLHDGDPSYFRLSIPLSEERVAMCRSRLAPGPP
jgi:histidinol-phosphate/aromatic aminotransferase/cobyric acid decarboxylase-like protein